MKIKISATVDIGKERDNNEDAYIYCPDLSCPNWQLQEMSTYTYLGEYGAILVVADGMGGQNAGEVASETAVNAIKKSVSHSRIEKAIKTEDSVECFLREIVREADDAIKLKINEDTVGMGTTIVVCWVLKNKAYIVWCGDSRCYLYNPSKGLKLLTKDHSFVQELVDKGEISEEDALEHPDSNLITKSLGGADADSEPDFVSYDINGDDYLLLCSDGLCGYCFNKDIERIMSVNHHDISVCRDKLMNLALDAGGYDNICIVLASLINDNQIKPSNESIIQRVKRLLKIAN